MKIDHTLVYGSEEEFERALAEHARTESGITEHIFPGYGGEGVGEFTGTPRMIQAWSLAIKEFGLKPNGRE